MAKVGSRTGFVIALEADRPTVRLDDGAEWRCRLRGRLRRDAGQVLVGDRVEVTPIGAGEGWVEAVLPRGVVLERPPLANVHGLIVGFSLRDPAGSLWLLDRRLVLAELMGLAAVIAVTKVDLLTAEDRHHLDPWVAQYPVVWTSARTGEGLAALSERLAGGIWVLTGESGAGKSSLINALVPGAGARVQDLSRIGRGRQTTRTVRLYPVGNAWLADTPGFTRLDLPRVPPRQVMEAFSELRELQCRFADCLHLGEPGCALPDALGRTVAPIRYEHYRTLAAELAATGEGRRQREGGREHL